MGTASLSFGWFEVDRELARTADALLCAAVHRPAHRTYLMRTEVTAASAPQPANAEFERGRVRDTAELNRRLYDDAYWRRRGRTTPAGRELVVQEYFGVLAERYLIPVSATYSYRGAMPFEQILRFPTSLVRMLPFWENLWLLLTSETGLLPDGSIPFTVWTERWGGLVRRSELGRRLVGDLPAELSEGLRSAIAEQVDDCQLGVGPSLEESAVVRLLLGVSGRAHTEEQVRASLHCPFFRLNVTVHDLHYAVALNHLLEPQPWMVQSPLEWLGPTALTLPTVIDGLLAQPASFPADAHAFERCAPPDADRLASFTLFLQDPERTARPYVALQRL